MVMMAALLAVPAAAGAAAKIDYAQPGSAFQILAPGEWGGLPLNDQSTDQLKMYDALTPLRGNVTQADLEANFISERFGAQGPGQTVEPTPQAGLTVTRDRYGVAHIYGKTRSATMFGVARLKLANNVDGNHDVKSDKPVGISVYGYGQYTSYWYPGGLNLEILPQ